MRPNTALLLKDIGEVKRSAHLNLARKYAAATIFMSGQVYFVDNVHVTAATEKLARFKVHQKLQIQIDSDVSASECSTLMSRDDEPPTPTSSSLHDDDSLPLGDEEMSCEKKKRRRRTAAQIDRKFVCSYAGCKKAYGSEGSLTQHMRLKHRSLTLSHRDRGQLHRDHRSVSHMPMRHLPLVVSTYFNCNNIAIRPAISFVVDMAAAYNSAPAGFLHECMSLLVGMHVLQLSFAAQDMFHGMEKLRMRSNSMPTEGYTQQCDTPRWKKATTTTTPQSARAAKSKTLKGKMKRSQSMSSPPETPERGVFTTPRGLVPAVEALHLSPHCTYLPQSTDQAYRGKDMSLLHTLDWVGHGGGAAANPQMKADVASDNNDDDAATDLSVLQSLVDDCPHKHPSDECDVIMGMSPEVPTSPPLYAEFPLDDDMMETSNQYDNDVYYKASPPSSSSSSTSSGWNNNDMDLVSSSFLPDSMVHLLVRSRRSKQLDDVDARSASDHGLVQFASDCST
ncbi:hypothetical protein DYB30_000010 [Aphanomyces astaci]|uniref:C2H2-type domain-containing protein n=1 Tax=Aphanomyces astaci TaxID=112090 RepID=A0A397EHV1_APHAT|nr:hypothetical protein DYB36_006122 [Aphanomyces astaci]RHY42283.1 hypothetical protein DYB38_000121 [Aphanomyces astaci]RHY70675.1 hypothetical protein DYB34_000341 [Aphanomyces astaci]RHY74600.1 hypothetical protein DYB30_000010 [Aphanomyces astaci]RHY78690.1 hypothetical protein DYB31_005276 [Aphanomyces astaci]